MYLTDLVTRNKLHGHIKGYGSCTRSSVILRRFKFWIHLLVYLTLPNNYVIYNTLLSDYSSKKKKIKKREKYKIILISHGTKKKDILIIFIV